MSIFENNQLVLFVTFYIWNDITGDVVSWINENIVPKIADSGCMHSSGEYYAGEPDIFFAQESHEHIVNYVFYPGSHADADRFLHNYWTDLHREVEKKYGGVRSYATVQSMHYHPATFTIGHHEKSELA